MNRPEGIALIGAGGHAKVIISTLQAAGLPILGLFDDSLEKSGQALLGVPVIGKLADLESLGACPAIIAVGDNRARQRLARRFEQLVWQSVVHPRAWVHPTVRLGTGSVVFAGAVVQPDAHIGAHCIINTGATIDHDCRLGDFVHAAPGVHLAGGVTLEEGVFCGIGTVAIPGRRVGAWSIVGAGGVVVRDIPAQAVATGIPARTTRKIEE